MNIGITKARISGNYILDLRKRADAHDVTGRDPPERASNGGDDKGHIDAADVEFKDVSFAYERRPALRVLKSINVQVSALDFSGVRDSHRRSSNQ